MSSFETTPSLISGLNNERLRNAHDALHMYSGTELSEWVASHTRVRTLGSQSFRMLVAPGEDPRKVLFSGGELGNGLDALGAIARLRTIAEAVSPEATIVYQPNTTLTQDNMNFSRAERRVLRQGSNTPMTDRILVTISELKDATDFTAYGPSQGGTTVLDFAADERSPATATALLETPNIEDRSLIRIGKDYADSGKMLHSTIQQNFTQTAPLLNDLLGGITNPAMIGYGLGLVKQDNLALIAPMRRSAAESQITAALHKEGSIVHAWATGGTVASHAVNLAIADRLDGHARYEAHVVEGDHSATNNYLFSAAIVQRAIDLKRS